MRNIISTFFVIAVASMTCAARAGTLYFNGFELGQPGTADFYDSSNNTQGADITIVPSGGGSLHLTAPGGSNYAEITNVPDAYQNPGYGQSVYTDYGAQRLSLPSGGIAISGAFYESTEYYINTSWAAAGPDNNFEGFWIDTTPNTDPGYLDETNFRISDTGNNQIGVEFVGLNGTGNTTITQSGWYTFKTTFQNDGSGNVLNNMSVIDSNGNVIGSYGADSSLPVASLTGTSYGDWTTVWEDGFAGDVLGIDNVEVGTISGVPLPGAVWGGGLLMAGLALWNVCRNRREALA
jgi:hypothetical protein